MKNNIPVLVPAKGDCNGCSACYNICLKNAIDMIEDSEGFLYPSINGELCIRCYRCLAVCPLKKEPVVHE